MIESVVKHLKNEHRFVIHSDTEQAVLVYNN